LSSHKTLRSTASNKRVVCCECCEVKLVGVDGNVHDPVVGIECWPIDTAPIGTIESRRLPLRQSLHSWRRELNPHEESNGPVKGRQA
jgi:hypothetical protein